MAKNYRTYLAFMVMVLYLVATTGMGIHSCKITGSSHFVFVFDDHANCTHSHGEGYQSHCGVCHCGENHCRACHCEVHSSGLCHCHTQHCASKNVEIPLDDIIVHNSHCCTTTFFALSEPFTFSTFDYSPMLDSMQVQYAQLTLTSNISFNSFICRYFARVTSSGEGGYDPHSPAKLHLRL